MAGLTLAPDGRRISYSQNAEDIVLLRAFGDSESGTWIDVVANDPVRDSVTKNFYDIGWRGVNIEPVAILYDRLMEERPRDVNLSAAVSDRSGTMEFHRNDSNPDLSTFDEALVAQYRARGDDIVDIPVPVYTLASVCDEFVDVDVIDFLKIDVEGHELSVVRGHDFQKYPVRALCAESSTDVAGELSEYLEGVGMRKVMFDGLNSWFVRLEEMDTLGKRLGVPAVRVLDWYHPFVYLEQMQVRDERIAELQRQVANLEQKLRSPAGYFGRVLRGLLGR